MGIHNLNKLLKSQCPQVFKILPLSELQGHRIAIDAYNIAYKYLSVAHSRIVGITDVAVEEPDSGKILNTWLSLTLDFVVKLRKFNITPVFCFDGDAPAEKIETKEKRAKVKQNSRDEIKSLREDINKGDILDSNLDKLSRLRQLCKTDIRFSRTDMETFQGVLENLGIPIFYSMSEGEKLCSSLCRENFCTAVLTKDTDALTFGAPIVITGFNDDDKEAFDAIILQDVLEGLGISFESFVDLCIMCKCDYNTNIKGIGHVKAYKLIKEYGRIEFIPSLPSDWRDTLRYKECLNIFSNPPLESIIKSYTKEDIDTEILNTYESRELLKQYGLLHYHTKFVN